MSLRRTALGTVLVDGRGRTLYLFMKDARRRSRCRSPTSGHPLYRFIGDGSPGDTNGHGLKKFGARWYAVKASGARAGAVKPQATPPPYPPDY